MLDLVLLRLEVGDLSDVVTGKVSDGRSVPGMGLAFT